MKSTVMRNTRIVGLDQPIMDVDIFETKDAKLLPDTLEESG